MDKEVLLKTEFKDLKLFRRGKVRDVYDLGEFLLMVSTDRISCFDVVMNEGIPNKGRVLTALSLFWFEFLKDVIPNHFVSADIQNYPEEARKYKTELAGRSMLVAKSKPLAVECIVRGYLSGSGWKEYKQKGAICGITLPGGLKESDKLPQPVFTPSTKADVGHDVNVDQSYVRNLLGKELADLVERKSLEVYRKAEAYAAAKGIIIADTKFEFGLHNGELILIDEVLTPDSSRFWPAKEYKPGRPQASFDKQYVRDYLEELDWDKNPPAPHLPEEIIVNTEKKYLEAYRILAGKELKG